MPMVTATPISRSSSMAPIPGSKIETRWMWRINIAILTLFAATAAAADRRTTVAIQGQAFFINGQPTYPGRVFQGMKVEGLLMNARLVQGIFDDSNPQTRSRWNY